MKVRTYVPLTVRTYFDRRCCLGTYVRMHVCVVSLATCTSECSLFSIAQMGKRIWGKSAGAGQPVKQETSKKLTFVGCNEQRSAKRWWRRIEVAKVFLEDMDYLVIEKDDALAGLLALVSMN